MIPIEEAEVYVRMTLKEKGFADLTVEWVDESRKSFLGLAFIFKRKITFNKRILSSFTVFREVVLHEIAHFEQAKRNGGRFPRRNGRFSYHGKEFKEVCAEFGIPARTKIPV